MSPTPEEKAAALAFADALPGCTDTQRHMKVLAALVRNSILWQPWSGGDAPVEHFEQVIVETRDGRFSAEDGYYFDWDANPQNPYDAIVRYAKLSPLPSIADGEKTV